MQAKRARQLALRVRVRVRVRATWCRLSVRASSPSDMPGTVAASDMLLRYTSCRYLGEGEGEGEGGGERHVVEAHELQVLGERRRREEGPRVELVELAWVRVRVRVRVR